MISNDGAAQMTWVSMPPTSPYTNFGDALSPIIVSAISGRRLRKAGFHQNVPRIAAVGTIAHSFRNGEVHVWGTGLDRTINPVDRALGAWTAPPDTRFVIHATRGSDTRRILVDNGIAAPEVYGDPGWFCHRIWPELVGIDKTFDLGIVLHLSELEAETPDAAPRASMPRYHIPASLRDRICTISTITDRSVAGVRATVEKIARCRRILSTSLHGLVVAEAMGVPAFYYCYTGPQGPGEIATDDATRMDHRMRDLYAGAGYGRVPAYTVERRQTPDWQDLIAWTQGQDSLLRSDLRPLFDAFPLPPAVGFDDARWPVRDDLLVDCLL